MKKFGLSFLGFGIFALITYCSLIIIWGELAPGKLKKNLNYMLGAYGHLFTRVKDASTTTDVDILFLGSSHCYRGFDTRIFRDHGFKTFNLGSSGQSPMQTHILLERYLDKLNPKLIVYEIYPGIFSSDGVESALDIIANDRIDYRIAQMVIQLNNIKIYNAFIYGLYRQVFNRNSGFKESLRKDNDTYISGGFVERKMEFYSPHMGFLSSISEWRPESRQLKAFELSLQLIHKKGKQLMLVEAPVVSTRRNEYSNRDEISNYFSSQGPYINFNEIVLLDDSLDFYDHHHLNQAGVEKFNAALIKQLIR